MALVAAVLAVVPLVGSGCGPALFTVQTQRAGRAVQRASEADAPRFAPYEFYSAAEHLRKARQEASEASYEDALQFARIAYRHAVEALRLTHERRPH